MLSVIGLFTLITIAIIVATKFKKKGGAHRELMRMYKKVIPLASQMDTAIYTMKDRAVNLMTQAEKMDRRTAECKNDVMNAKATEISKKMKEKAKEIADKALEYESKKTMLLSEKQLLETMIEFYRVEKGLDNFESPYASLKEIEDSIKDLEAEVKALDTLF